MSFHKYINLHIHYLMVALGAPASDAQSANQAVSSISGSASPGDSGGGTSAAVQLSSPAAAVVSMTPASAMPGGDSASMSTMASSPAVDPASSDASAGGGPDQGSKQLPPVKGIVRGILHCQQLQQLEIFVFTNIICFLNMY
jgi:hypothetical protein